MCPKCLIPFSTIMVRRDGIIQACCYNPIPMGNLNSQTVEEIWWGENYRKLRDSIVNESFSFGCKMGDCPIMQNLKNSESKVQ
jgi:hypothetical protein